MINFKGSMERFCLLISLIGFAHVHESYAQWLPISNVRHQWEQSEMGGPVLNVSYQLESPEITPDSPAYIFVRFRISPTSPWSLLSTNFMRGNGNGLVCSSGAKAIQVWGFRGMTGTNASTLELKVKGILMVRIPAGIYRTKTIPGGGYDASKHCVDPNYLSTYYISKNETTWGMYVDFLNELSDVTDAWHSKMGDAAKGGIEQYAPGKFRLIPGRENYPVLYVNWYTAAAFLEACGLRLPNEAEWEKAFRGGVYLEGDAKKQRLNPIPDRPYPWGNETPEHGGIYRCNVDGEQDGFVNTSPVGSFSKYSSPYGVNDLAGNAAEWTLDWYATSFHAGLDGFRMLRGGSYMDPPAGVDAISAPTSLPNKKSSIMGFRGVWTSSATSND